MDISLLDQISLLNRRAMCQLKIQKINNIGDERDQGDPQNDKLGKGRREQGVVRLGLVRLASLDLLLGQHLLG